MIFQYKRRFVTFTLLLAYAFMHIALTGLYSELSFEGFIRFSVPLPYAQRLLLPALVHYLVIFLPLTPEESFFLMEWLFITLFYFVLRRLLQEEFNPQQAQLLSWFCILALPLITVVNYRFQSQGGAAVFYPSDTASLFFIITGFLFCLREQWYSLIFWIFLATLNRESSILLVFMIPALHWQQRRMILKPFLLGILVYLLARILVLQFLVGTPGALVEWFLQDGVTTHFQDNLHWLLNAQNILLFVFCFAGLPLLWFAFYDYLPQRYRPLRYVALLYFSALLMVGRFMEARIFTEILALLYLPVCVALRNWLSGFEPVRRTKYGFCFYFDRYFVLSVLAMILILREPLNRLILALNGCNVYLVHCMPN